MGRGEISRLAEYPHPGPLSAEEGDAAKGYGRTSF
jgi:hypothetical protein